MTTPELLKSLSDEQAKAFNAALVEMRDGVNAARDTNEQTLAAAHKEIATAKDADAAKLQSLINDGNEQRLKLQAEFDEYKFQASAAMDLTNSGANDAIAALKGALAKSQSDLAALQSQVSSGIATIQGIVADPETDTEKGIIAFLKDATKDERTKRREALEAQLAELEKQIAALA